MACIIDLPEIPETISAPAAAWTEYGAWYTLDGKGGSDQAERSWPGIAGPGLGRSLSMNSGLFVPTDDERWMQRALQLAQRAEAAGEVPVGAVLVKDGQLFGEGWNSTIQMHDPSAHAEIMALRAAGSARYNYRLPGSTLFVTLEPCVMCAGAIVHARVERLVFGAWDRRAGAAGSVFDIVHARQLNHQVRVEGGVLEPLCAEQLRNFFAARRPRSECSDG